MNAEQSPDQVNAELFELVAYLLASARGLYDEPPGYGSFRLLDAAARLLAIMERDQRLDPFLAGLKARLDAEREANMDDQRQFELLERSVIEIAGELKRRLTPSSPQ